MQQEQYMERLQALMGAEGVFDWKQMQKAPCICFNPQCEFHLPLVGGNRDVPVVMLMLNSTGEARQVRRYQYKFGRGGMAFSVYLCQACHTASLLVHTNGKLASMSKEAWDQLQF